MKDWLLSKALQTLVRERLARYGELKSLAVHSRNKTVDIVVRPHGEAEDVHLSILRYTVLHREGKWLLTIEASTASRPWIATVLEDHLHGRSFEIPPIAGAVL